MRFCQFLSSLALAGLGAFSLHAQVPTANPPSVALSTPAFSTTAVSQTVTITGAVGQQWRIQSVGGFWLRFLVAPTCPASVNDCTTTNSGSTTVTLLADPSGLPAFLYTGYLSITYPGGTVTVPVSLNVGGATNSAVVGATPASLSFAAAPGGSAQTQPLAITSSGTASALSFTVASSAAWLTTNLGGGSTAAPANLTITADPTGLAANTYNGTLTITPVGGAAAPITVAVTLTLTEPRVLTANPASVTFNALPGGSSPAAVPVAINISSGTPAAYTASVSYPGLAALSWLSISTTTGQTGSSIFLTATPGSLPAGTYAASVNITSTGLATLSLPVTLTISSTQPTPRLTSDVTAIALNVAAATSTSRTFQISTSTGAAIPFTITPSPAASWLSLNTNAGNTPTNVTLTANPGTLAAGTYSTTLFISSSNSAFTSLNLPVTLTVAGGGTGTSNPTVLFSPTQLSFSAPVNGAAADQSLSVTSSTTTQVPFTLSANVPWLSVLTSNGTTPSTATLRVNAAGLAVGTYSANLALNAPGAANNGTLIPVTLTITGGTGQPLILAPTSLSFIAQASGTPPPPRSVTVTSTGTSTAIPYTVSSTQTWLQGIASTDSTPGNIAVYVNPTGLAAGTYSGNLLVFSTGFTTTLPVTLEVTSGPLLRLSQQSLTFNYQNGQLLPLPRTILVTSPAGTSLAASISTSTSSGGNWLVATAGNVQTPGAFAVGLVSNIVTTLAPGSYSGTVTVSTTGTNPLTSTINVILNVSNSGLLTMSTTPVIFNAEANGNQPPAQTRAITSTSGTLAVTSTVATSNGSGWLVASVNSNTTPANLTISASPAGLAPGTYSGSITVSTTSSGTVLNSALVIPVTLTVGQIPALNVDKSELIFSGANSASPQTIQVNSTSGSLSYTVSTNVGGLAANWLTVAPPPGQTPSTLAVLANPSLLSDGTYFGTVTLTPQTGASSALTIPVTLIVNRGTALQVAPTSLSFTQIRNAPLPGQQAITVGGVAGFSFSTSVQTPAGGNWLNVAQSNQTLLVALNSNAPLLAAGNYTAIITIFDPTSGSSVPVAVNLTVVGTNTLVATPNAITFNGRLGQPSPAPQTVAISSSAPGVPLSFNVTSDAPWLLVTPLAGTTPTVLTLSVNAAALPANTPVATGRLTLVPLTGGLTTTITVSFIVEASPAPVINAFANSATFQPGPLSPGMLFSIVGTNLGPTQALSAEVVNGRFPTSLAGVRVLFDGIPAPILYASATQINAAVPYQLFGRAQSQMTVEYNGQTSTALAPRIADTAPGIFTTDGRQAAAINGDGGFNNAANPAAAGSIVVIYLTGEGQTSPAGVDGEVVAASNLKRPLGAVRVRVNGVEVPASDILYAGSAPALVAGLMQINFRLPAGLPANAATPVEVFVGAGQSPTGATLAIR